jgi:hypothetical protein
MQYTGSKGISMKRWFTHQAALTLGLALIGLVLASSVQAYPVQPRPINAAAVGANAQIIAQLKATRALLNLADRDYQGHRAKAVHEITKAIHRLANLPGKAGQGPARQPGGKEAQDVSDAQLRQGIQQLQQIETLLNNGKHPRALTHIQTAIKEMQTALTIR